MAPPSPPTMTLARALRVFNAVNSALRQWGSSLHHNGLSYLPVTVPAGSVFYHGAPSAERPQGLEWLSFELEHGALFSTSSSEEDWPRTDPGIRTGPGGDNGPLAERPWLSWSLHGRFEKDRAERELQMKQQKEKDNNGGEEDGWRDLQGIPDGQKPEQRPMHFEPETDSSSPPSPTDVPAQPFLPQGRGYLQTYRTKRELRLLYIDGMSAAASLHGTSDTQDLVLLGWRPEDAEHDYKRIGDRVQQLCALAAGEWGGAVDGIVRNEVGFEIVLCNFSDATALERVSVVASPFSNQTAARRGQKNGYDNGDGIIPGGTTWGSVIAFTIVRAATRNYDGLWPTRLSVDYSHMVSALFYPDVNTTNPDPRRAAELPRLSAASSESRAMLRGEVVHALRDAFGTGGGGGGGGGDDNLPPPTTTTSSFPSSSINWQAVTDDIVIRFSDPLRMLASGADADAGRVQMLSELGMTLSPFLDFSDAEAHDGTKDTTTPLARCRDLPLGGAQRQRATWTAADENIHAALSAVSEKVCGELLAIRDMLELLQLDGEEEGACAAAMPLGQEDGDNNNDDDDDDEEEEDDDDDDDDKEELERKVVETAQRRARRLMELLRWPDFTKQCEGGCDGAAGEVCFVAMFPFGTEEDHFSPSCKNRTTMGFGYWPKLRKS